MVSDQRPNRELVVYALGLLGGEFERIHTEDLALKCHELFPDAFSWAKYPEIPDKDIVRVALTDARKEKYGSLVRGRSGQSFGHSSRTDRDPTPDGWTLTTAGVEWFRSEAKAIEDHAESRNLKGHRQRALRRLRRVYRHQLWTSFSESSEAFSPSLGELASLLRCRVDAPKSVWEKRLQDLERDGRAGEDTDLEDFIAACRRAYERAR